MKNVLITGATRNTGFAAARLFAKEGYGVAITGRDKERAVAAANAIADEFGVKAAGYGLDITDTAEVERVFLQAENDFGSIDVFVANSANLGIGCGAVNTSEREFDEIVSANVRGTFFCCQSAAKIMKRHGGGSIVTVGSVQATGAVRGRCVYAMTKAAISVLVKNLAFELGEYGIRANNVVAGAIHTERWDGLSADELEKRRAKYPAGREATEDEIANAIYYLASEKAASITGIDLTVDSGISVCILPYEKEKKDENN